METHPERGDALGHIDEDTLFVVALHVCGLHYHEHIQLPIRQFAKWKQYTYDKNNFHLIDICMKVGASLIAWHEQPDWYEHTGATATQIHGATGGPVGWIYEPGGKGEPEFEATTLAEFRARGDGYSTDKYKKGVEDHRKYLRSLGVKVG